MNIVILGKKGVGKTHLAIEIENHLLPGAIIHNDLEWSRVPLIEPQDDRSGSHIFVVKAGTAPLPPILKCEMKACQNLGTASASYFVCSLDSHYDDVPHNIVGVDRAEWMLR